MTRVYVDTNVFLYAIGTSHSYREPCRAIVGALGAGHLSGETSVETLQEIVHHRRRRGDADATGSGRRAADLCSVVHPIDRQLALAALDLIDLHPDLPTRDALHAATALATDVAVMLSTDSDFDAIPAIKRVDPADRAAVQRLADS